MTTKHDDGGPAFPRQYDDVWHDGMTLWDEFAKAALSYCRGGDYRSFADLATYCANIADAMLAERRKRGIGS